MNKGNFLRATLKIKQKENRLLPKMFMIPALFTEDMTHSEGLACRTSLEATTYCGSMFFWGRFFR